MHQFEPGDRVRVRGDAEFPDGITGTICLPESSFQLSNEDGSLRTWDGAQLTIDTEKGRRLFYFVKFDEPHDDGNGDGPYSGSEILADHLEPVA